jgi:hypothetical protein
LFRNCIFCCIYFGIGSYGELKRIWSLKAVLENEIKSFVYISWLSSIIWSIISLTLEVWITFSPGWLHKSEIDPSFGILIRAWWIRTLMSSRFISSLSTKSESDKWCSFSRASSLKIVLGEGGESDVSEVLSSRLQGVWGL